MTGPRAADGGAEGQQPEEEVGHGEPDGHHDDAAHGESAGEAEVARRGLLLLEECDEPEGQQREGDELQGNQECHGRGRRRRVGVDDEAGDHRQQGAEEQ